jgi:hypothetical protein
VYDEVGFIVDRCLKICLRSDAETKEQGRGSNGTSYTCMRDPRPSPVALALPYRSKRD